jgi:hypothetical protein
VPAAEAVVQVVLGEVVERLVHERADRDEVLAGQLVRSGLAQAWLPCVQMGSAAS